MRTHEEAWAPVDFVPRRGDIYLYIFISFKILFIYSQETQREGQRHRQKEKQAPCGKPDAGLDPRTPGSRPEPQVDAQPLSNPGVPPTMGS